MSNPDTALKNAVFEYLLATNMVKSAEMFFKESNLEAQYDVPVDEMVLNTQQYGNSCLICKLFNNWYSFAHNQRQITPTSSSFLLHTTQKDENLLHMQQFLDFYHTHDKHQPNTSTIHTCTSPEHSHHLNSTPQTIPNTSTTSSAPSTKSNTTNSSSSFSTHPIISTSALTTVLANSSLSHHSPLRSYSPANSSPNSTPETIMTPPTLTNTNNNNEVMDNNNTSTIVESSLEKSSDSIAKENEYLFSVERKLFQMSHQRQDIPTINSDALLQLLSLDSGTHLNFTTPSSTPPTNSHSFSQSPLPPAPQILGSSPHTHPHTHTHSHSHSHSHPHSHSHSHPHHHHPHNHTHSTPQMHVNPPAPPHSHTLPSQALMNEAEAMVTTTSKDDSPVDLSDLDVTADNNTKSSRFCCPYPNCSKSFSTAAILKRHIKEHSGDRPFKCTFEGCGKGFARNYDLKVHVRSHTGEKPYRCTFMGCERTFTRSSDLRLHERIHKGEKPFVCDCAGCQKRFVRYADLKKHKRTHEVHEGHHPHVHGAGCGHTAIAHEDHIDYLHDAHLHNHHNDQDIDDHKIGLSDTNPMECTHSHADNNNSTASPFVCDPTHTHNANCGHELVPHFDHYDYLVDGHLHYVHDSHCDDHGWIDVVNWNPSDFPLEGTPAVDDGAIRVGEAV